jgi:uncharacterized membrane protein
MVLIATLQSYRNASAPLIIINLLNVITVTTFELIYAALNLSCIKNANADFGFMIAC